MWEIALTTMTGDAAPHSDDLVMRAQAGDRAAFDEIMRLHERRVMAIALRLMNGNLADAQDAAQAVFLRLHKFLPRIREGENLSGWLYRVTANVCLDELKRRSAFVPLDETIEGGTDIERNVCDAERHAKLTAGLETLPPKERAAIVLRDIEGLETDEVARILGSTPATVRSQLCSARSKLRNYIARLRRRS